MWNWLGETDLPSPLKSQQVCLFFVIGGLESKNESRKPAKTSLQRCFRRTEESSFACSQPHTHTHTSDNSVILFLFCVPVTLWRRVSDFASSGDSCGRLACALHFNEPVQTAAEGAPQWERSTLSQQTVCTQSPRPPSCPSLWLSLAVYERAACHRNKQLIHLRAKRKSLSFEDLSPTPPLPRSWIELGDFSPLPESTPHGTLRLAVTATGYKGRPQLWVHQTDRWFSRPWKANNSRSTCFIIISSGNLKKGRGDWGRAEGDDEPVSCSESH